MTDETFKEALERAEKYTDASWDTSEELRFIALRAAVCQLIEALKRYSSTQRVNEK